VNRRIFSVIALKPVRPFLAGKRVILVDDDLAPGFTMLASVAVVKKW